MTWIKLDDKTPRHPKIGGLSDKAFRWWINSICYASEFLTDGVLSKVFWKRVPHGVRAELTKAKLWIFDDPNLVIHDYLEHQQSRQSVENERRRQRDRRNTDRGTADRRTAGTTAGTTSGTTPVRTATTLEVDTDTDKEKDTNTQSVRAARFDVWWTAYPKKTGKTAALKAWTKINPNAATLERMLSTLEWQRNQPQWTKDHGAYVPNPATYLNQGRWDDEPFFNTPAESPDDELMARLEAIERGEAKH
jgi:hypothetical protein